MTHTMSRRLFLGGSAAAAAAGLGGGSLLSGSLLAQVHAAVPTAAAAREVFLNLNEYPDGPSPAALRAIAEIAPRGGRYLDSLTRDLNQVFAAKLGIGVDHVAPYAGSFWPLNFSALAFASATAGVVTADPTFDAAARLAERNGASVSRIPLRSDYSHDAQAFIRAAQSGKAGLIYVCNPNNPTGTLTSTADIAAIVDNKPAGAVVVVDEAYIEFAGHVRSAVELVAKGKDVVVLRTFSKIYGLAGLRLGYAVARPDLLERFKRFGFSQLPVTAVVAGLASLNDPGLAETRRTQTATRRTHLVDWLKARGYATTPSEASFFLIDVKRPAVAYIDALKQRGVHVGRSPTAYPNSFRVTIGNDDENARFKAAFAEADQEILRGA
jgi:histidinol-phosphate aminotransferase